MKVDGKQITRIRVTLKNLNCEFVIAKGSQEIDIDKTLFIEIQDTFELKNMIYCFEKTKEEIENHIGRMEKV